MIATECKIVEENGKYKVVPSNNWFCYYSPRESVELKLDDLDTSCYTEWIEYVDKEFIELSVKVMRHLRPVIEGSEGE